MPVHTQRPPDFLEVIFKRLKKLESVVYGHYGASLRQPVGPWIYVGATGAPAFQNGWTNVGGTDTPLRFRTIIGGIELQGSITGGSIPSVVFNLPDVNGIYFPDGGDLYLATSDDSGAFHAWQVEAAGGAVTVLS
jgi:hypothetical protein